MYDKIKEVQERAKAQILEVDRFYSMASMDIFADYLREELTSIEAIFQKIKSSFEGVRNDIYIQIIFKWRYFETNGW